MTIIHSNRPVDGEVLEFDLADRVRKALRVSGIAVQDLADELEVSRGSVGNWINGRVVPNARTIRAIASVTEVPYEWLKGTDYDSDPHSFERV